MKYSAYNKRPKHKKLRHPV